MKFDRKFFHSFPRPRPSDTTETLVAKGIAILKLVKHTGIIITPETVEWTVPLRDDAHRSIKYDQLRVCFTELHETELARHSERFGPFALEFEIDTLRQMGALPVIYMPQSVGAGGLSAIGSVLVMEMYHVEATIALLEQLRLNTDERALIASNPQATSVAPDCMMQLQNTEEDGTVTNNFAVPLTAVRDLLTFVGFKNAPYAEMMNAISYAKSLFYPTDDKIHDEALAYYQQREWRIGRGLTHAGTVHSRALTEDEKREVIKVDQRFWTAIVGSPPARRIDTANVIERFGDGGVIDAISKVIVPPEAFGEAQTLFGDKVVSSDRFAREQ